MYPVKYVESSQDLRSKPRQKTHPRIGKPYDHRVKSHLPIQFLDVVSTGQCKLVAVLARAPLMYTLQLAVVTPLSKVSKIQGLGSGLVVFGTAAPSQTVRMIITMCALNLIKYALSSACAFYPSKKRECRACTSSVWVFGNSGRSVGGGIYVLVSVQVKCVQTPRTHTLSTVTPRTSVPRLTCWGLKF